MSTNSILMNIYVVDPTLTTNPMEIYDDEELKFKIRFRFTEGYCDKQVTAMVSRILKPY